MIDTRFRCLTRRTKTPLLASQDIVPSECGFYTSPDVPKSSLPFASTRKLDILRRFDICRNQDEQAYLYMVLLSQIE